MLTQEMHISDLYLDGYTPHVLVLPAHIKDPSWPGA